MLKSCEAENYKDLYQKYQRSLPRNFLIITKSFSVFIILKVTRNLIYQIIVKEIILRKVDLFISSFRMSFASMKAMME